MRTTFRMSDSSPTKAPITPPIIAAVLLPPSPLIGVSIAKTAAAAIDEKHRYVERIISKLIINVLIKNNMVYRLG